MADPDKYIVELEELTARTGNEFLPLQLENGGDGTTYKIQLKNIFPDAPADGAAYVRRNNTWVLLSSYLS